MRRLARHGLLLGMMVVGAVALAQPQEESVPGSVFKLPELRIFLKSPVWSAWKLPASKFLLAYVQAPASTGNVPVRQLVVLDAKGRLDTKRTDALKAALEQADPSGKCMAAGEQQVPWLMPLGSKGLVLQSGRKPARSCLFTWNARRATVEIQGADSVRDFCGEEGCPAEQCWWTEDCWLPEGPELDTARKGFDASPLATSLDETIPTPSRALLAATLPGSGRILLWAPSWRLADSEDPDKGTDSRILVYDPRKKAVDAALTRKLAQTLQAPTDECQGLGTLTDLQRGEQGVTLRQSYEHGRTHLSCSCMVTWNAARQRFEVDSHPSTDGSSGSGTRPGEGKDENAQALELWKAGRKNLAIAMWEGLYTHADYRDPATGELCDNLAFAYRGLSEFKKSEEVLLDCEKSFPERATFQLALGDTYRAMGRSKEAVERYQHFLEMEGGSAEQREAAEKSLAKLKKQE